MSERFRACWYAEFEPITPTQLGWLTGQWPWLPDEYLEFLGVSNGMVFETSVLFGVGEEHPYPLHRRQGPASWYDPNRFVVVGCGPAGTSLVLRRGGSVCTIESDPPPDQPEELCASFSELIDQVLCGPGFLKYRRGDTTESEWVKFLESKGWLGAPN